MHVDNTEKSLDESRITKMIMTIVGIFIFCNSFPVFYTIAKKDPFTAYILGLIAHFLVTINASINTVIYGIFNSKFKNVFRHHFWPGSQTEMETNEMASFQKTKLPKKSLCLNTQQTNS